MNKKIKELADLSRENPTLPIEFMVNNEVVGDDYGYWHCGISLIKIDDFYQDDEHVYCDSDEIHEHLRESYEDEDECQDLNDKDFDHFVEKKYKELELNGEIKKSIIVYLNA